jgi:hypothetical protein
MEAPVGGRFYGNGGGTGGEDSASALMQRGGGLLTLDTNSNNNSVRVNYFVNSQMAVESRVKATPDWLQWRDKVSPSITQQPAMQTLLVV